MSSTESENISIESSADSDFEPAEKEAEKPQKVKRKKNQKSIQDPKRKRAAAAKSFEHFFENGGEASTNVAENTDVNKFATMVKTELSSISRTIKNEFEFVKRQIARVEALVKMRKHNCNGTSSVVYDTTSFFRSNGLPFSTKSQFDLFEQKISDEMEYDNCVSNNNLL